MPIFSQDREAIYNFDNLTSVYVYGNRVIATTGYSDKRISECIGIYATKERALEVLEELWAVNGIHSKFHMPED